MYKGEVPILGVCVTTNPEYVNDLVGLLYIELYFNTCL